MNKVLSWRCAALLSFAFGSVLLLLCSWLLLLPSKYDRITEGMSPEDVRSILGEPTWKDSSILVERQGRWIEASREAWEGSEDSIVVAFDKENRRLCYKSYNSLPKSLLERIRGWFGL